MLWLVNTYISLFIIYDSKWYKLNTTANRCILDTKYKIFFILFILSLPWDNIMNYQPAVMKWLIKKCLGSSLLEVLVIYSICKCSMPLIVRYLMREEKGLIWKGSASPYWDLKQNLCRQNNTWSFKCKIWSKITKKFAKKCLDVSSRA